MDQSQTDSAALVLAFRMQPLEDTEQAVRIPIVESDTVVLDEINVGCALFVRSNLDGRQGYQPCELPSVRDQIYENLTHQCAIAKGRRQEANNRLHVTGGILRVKFVHDGL